MALMMDVWEKLLLSFSIEIMVGVRVRVGRLFYYQFVWNIC